MPCLRPHSRSGALVIAALVLLSAGCTGRYLVASPNLLRNQDPERVFAECSPLCRVPEMQVLYATDRAVEEGQHPVAYGSGRARSLAFGTATVSLNPTATWQELARDSTDPERRHAYELKVTDCREIGHFETFREPTPTGTNGFQLTSGSAAQSTPHEKALHEMLHERLAGTMHKDVFVFIHGFNNSFDDGVFRAAEVWHFLGRVGVPVAYTWPAGSAGLLGYAYDRESGEFTVFHLKQFLRSLAACPDVERIHLVAHSRGTDVAISALRELHIACRAQGKSTQQELKLENLVLAAPDLDEDVFMQRFVVEGLLGAARRTTIYASRRDKALEFADLIFASRQRLGALGPRDFSPQVRQVLARLPELQFVECKVTHFSTSHDYVFAHPAALSDLILVLRDRRDPGAASGRPLQQPVEGVWEVTNDYPRTAGGAQTVMQATYQRKGAAE